MNKVGTAKIQSQNEGISPSATAQPAVQYALETPQAAVNADVLGAGQLPKLEALAETTSQNISTLLGTSETLVLPTYVGTEAGSSHRPSSKTFRNICGADARVFAIEAHGEQKYGNRPYSYHLERVAELATRFATGEIKPYAEIVAWLHDVLEDTSIPPAALIAAFGPKIAWAVQELSGTSEESKDEEFARLQKASPLAKFVKACDLTANMAACVEDLNVEYLKGYADNLPRYQKALGEALSGELLKSCIRASQASKLGINDQVEHTFRTNASDGLAIHTTLGTERWCMDVQIKDGLVCPGSGPETTPSKPYERKDW